MYPLLLLVLLNCSPFNCEYEVIITNADGQIVWATDFANIETLNTVLSIAKKKLPEGKYIVTVNEDCGQTKPVAYQMAIE